MDRSLPQKVLARWTFSEIQRTLYVHFLFVINRTTQQNDSQSIKLEGTKCTCFRTPRIQEVQLSYWRHRYAAATTQHNNGDPKTNHHPNPKP